MQKQSRARRRWRALDRIVSAVALGIATTVGVAWGSALVGDRFPVTRHTVERDGDHLQLWILKAETWASSRVIWFEKGRIYNKPGVGPAMGSSAAVSNWSYATRTRSIPGTVKGVVDLPPDVRARIDESPAKVVEGKVVGVWGEAVDRRGWPWASMEGRIVGTMNPKSEGPYVAEVGVMLAGSSRSGPGGVPLGSSESLADIRVLPGRVLWRGFLIDALCAGAAWWVVLTLAGAAWNKVVERRRKRIGCCRKCGYDLAGISGEVCPECGTSTNSPTSIPVAHAP